MGAGEWIIHLGWEAATVCAWLAENGIHPMSVFALPANIPQAAKLAGLQSGARLVSAADVAKVEKVRVGMLLCCRCDEWLWGACLASVAL